MKRDDDERVPGPHMLSGLRILDLGTMVAGPVACTLFADFGADVIKVEVPERGDTVRAAGPDHHEVSLAGYLAEVVARPIAGLHRSPLEDLGREVQRALVAVPQPRAEAVAIGVCLGQ